MKSRFQKKGIGTSRNDSSLYLSLFESNGSKPNQNFYLGKLMGLMSKILVGGSALITALGLTLGAAKASDNISKYPTESQPIVQQVDEDRAVGWASYVLPSHIPGSNALVKDYLIRDPPGSIDTLYSITDIHGWSSGLGSNFEPDAQGGDILHKKISKDTLGKLYKARQRRELEEGVYIYFPGVCLNDPDKPEGYTITIREIIDTLPISSDLYAVSYIEKNPLQKDTSIVDTSDLHSYDDYWYHTQSQDSSLNLGDIIYTSIFKTRNDSAWYNFYSVPLQDTSNNAIPIADTNYFSEHSPVWDIAAFQTILPDTVESNAVFTPGFRVNNYGTVSPLWFYINIGGVYEDSLYQSVVPGGPDGVIFDPCSIGETGSHPVIVYSKLEDDVNPYNDTLWDTIEVVSTGVSEYKQEVPRTPINIYPTITKDGKVNISGLEGKLNVYNVAGQKVHEYEVNGTGTFEIHGPAGVYFIKPKNNEISIVKILLIQ